MSEQASSTIDPVLTAVIANRIDGVVREMTNTLLRAGRSAVINSARDFSCAIVTGDNQLLACAEGLPIHIFGVHNQARTMTEYHADLAEGDEVPVERRRQIGSAVDCESGQNFAAVAEDDVVRATAGGDHVMA